MNCPICKNKIDSGVICGKCGRDAVLSEKLLTVSNLLYNRGLLFAQNRDLSRAYDSLNKAILLNKRNTQARNLLGLICYETGKIGEALKQWVISANINSEKGNIAFNYIDKVKTDKLQLEKYNESVKLYNQALNYINQKNDDMAIIQLKKSLDINPSFIDATNLLCLCYMTRLNEIPAGRDKALALINKVLEADAYNITASYYLSMLFPSKKPGARRVESKLSQILSPDKTVVDKKENKKETKEQTDVPYKPYIDTSKRNSGSFALTNIFMFVVGGLFAFALVYLLLVPGMLRERDDINDGLNQEINKLTANLTSLTEQFNNDLAKADRENQTLSGIISEQETVIEKQRRDSNLTSLVNILNSGDFVRAADVADIYNADELAEMSENDLLTYERIKSEAYPRASKILCDAGVDDYKLDDIENAKNKFLKSLKYYVDANPDYRDTVYYYLGLIAEKEEDFEKAAEYFQLVVDDYKKSNFYYLSRDAAKRVVAALAKKANT